MSYRALVLWQRDFDPTENHWASAITDRVVCVWVVPSDDDAGYSEEQVRREIWATVLQATLREPGYAGWDKQSYPQWRVTETEARLPHSHIVAERYPDD